MADMGLQLDEHEQIKLDNMIAEILSAKEQTKPDLPTDKSDAAKTTIQDRLRERVSECLGELEGMFDDFVTAGAKITADYKPVSLMRSMNIAPQLISVIKDVWSSKLAEFEEVIVGRDAQLVQGYEFLTKTQLKNCVKFCELVITDCGAYVQIKKVERKPRKVKPVAPEKRAAKFKTLLEFPDLKLKSLPAASLVDKTEAWLYDTKKRKLIHLVADSHAQAFTVKNNTVIGFSTVETVQKTLRRPAEQLKEIVAAGKPAARKAFKDIKATETAWNARGTENLIILNAW
jgi:CHAT domain-containing protein